MAAVVSPRHYYVVFMTTTFRSLGEIQAAAPTEMAAHLARSRQLHGDGVLLMAGAFLDHPDEPGADDGCAGFPRRRRRLRPTGSFRPGRHGQRLEHSRMGQHVRLIRVNADRPPAERGSPTGQA